MTVSIITINIGSGFPDVKPGVHHIPCPQPQELRLLLSTLVPLALVGFIIRDGQALSLSSVVSSGDVINVHPLLEGG
jgi:hypothetical protein